MRCLSHGLFKALLLWAVLLGFCSPAMAQNWELARNVDGIKIYTRSVNGSEYQAFKAITKIRTSLKNLLAVMADTPSNCKWMHKCGKPTILKKVSYTERYIYQINYLPAPLWNRDIIMHTKATANKRGDEVIIRLKAAPEFCNTTKIQSCRNRDQKRSASNFVRITKAQGYYKLRKLSDRLVELTWQMHAEPGGDISGWMVNLNFLEIPLETLKGLKTHMRQLKIRKRKLRLARK